MIKKVTYFALILIAFTSCQEQQKTGFINNSEVINEYQGKKDVEEKFKALDITSKKKGDSLNQASQIEAMALQAKYPKLSPQQLQQKPEVQAFQQKWNRIQQQMQTEQQNMQTQFQTEIDSSIAEVVDFVKEYAKTNNYSYIYGTSDATRSVIYGPEENDLTQSILDQLNKKHKEKE